MSSGTRPRTPNHQVKKKGGIIEPPGLEIPLKCLADSTQNAMAALYKLQTALTHAAARQESAAALLGQLHSSRDFFGAEWEEHITFLQNCHLFAEDYVSLLELSASRSPEEYIPFAADVLDLARQNLREVEGLRTRHESAWGELQKQKQKQKLNGELSNPSSGADTRKAAKRPSPDAKGTGLLPQFVQVAHASLFPDGPQSLLEVESALRGISTALGDLSTFCRYQIEHLEALSRSSGDALRLALEDSRASINYWKTNQKSLLATIASITASADAIVVDAVVTPIIPPVPTHRRSLSYPSRSLGTPNQSRIQGKAAAQRPTRPPEPQDVVFPPQKEPQQPSTASAPSNDNCHNGSRRRAKLWRVLRFHDHSMYR